MSIIYCGKANRTPYYIKEADINIYSIQQLAYFIYNYVMLISTNFITKNLIVYIDKMLEQNALAAKLNEMYNKKTSLPDMLLFILSNSNYYSDEEINKFRNYLIQIMEYPEEVYINKAGDILFNLKKYEKAIQQYSKISKVNNEALLKLAKCYAKLQFYEMAINYYTECYQKTNSLEVLREAYYCLKLNNTVDRIYDIEQHIDENLLTEWELEIVKELVSVSKSDVVKAQEDIFLMGSNHIRQNVESLIKIWKEKYRYIG